GANGLSDEVGRPVLFARQREPELGGHEAPPRRAAHATRRQTATFSGSRICAGESAPWSRVTTPAGLRRAPRRVVHARLRARKAYTQRARAAALSACASAHDAAAARRTCVPLVLRAG